MILAILLALQVAPAPSPADDIVVIGQRLQRWRAGITIRKGVMTCKTKQSTGDVAIDGIGCAAMKACWPVAQPRFEATRDTALSSDERKRIAAEANRDLGTCVGDKRQGLIADLATRRVAARSAK